MNEEQSTPVVRLDKWLWAVRVYKTRPQATQACRGGNVEVSGNKAKPSRSVHLGEVITARVGPIRRTVRVIGLIERRVSPQAAREHAEDLTPPAEYEKLRDPALRPVKVVKGFGRPTKKDRRKLERLFGRGMD